MTAPQASGTPGVEPAVSDRRRLEAVASTGLLDSASSRSFDSLTALARQLLRAPMAFLTLVDDRRSFWLSTDGVPEGRENPVEQSFCQYVIADRAPLVVADATVEARVSGNPSVELLGVRAWAGFPVYDPAGEALGSFCVMDTVVREWSEEDVRVLAVLSEAAAAHIALLSALSAERAARSDLEAVRGSERQAEERLERLASVTIKLAAADSAEALAEGIFDHALPVLGVDGGAIVLREADHMRLAVSGKLDEKVQLIYGVLPLDSPLPACHVARTGESLVLANRQQGLAFLPQMADVYADTERLAWAFLPLRVADRLLGSLAVCWADEREAIPAAELDLLAAFAAQCATAADRINAAAGQQAAARHAQGLLEALQRSLLTQPSAPPALELAVRYLPAVATAQIGGDWHDAHNNGLGSTLVSVGDVAGHESNSAAAMAQIRNLLRGLAMDSDDSPAVLLTRLDRAMDQFGLDIMASAVLGRVDQSAADGRRGLVRFRWSSAGHLPPVLRLPDGQVRILNEDSDPMLGISPSLERVERVTEMPYGSTLLLYTDGLVERRGESLTEGLRRLCNALAEHGSHDVETLADALLRAMTPQASDDDIALLVLRPQAVPGPPSAPLLKSSCGWSS